MRSGVDPGLYSRWKAMLNRCNNPFNEAYANYGGRGIKVCKEWHDYDTYAADVGPVPFAGANLDRRDNNKGYSKDNCHWVRPVVNSNNQRQYKTNTSGISGVCRSGFKWQAYTKAPQKLLYYGADFFEACCVRKSWEAKQKLISLGENPYEKALDPGV